MSDIPQHVRDAMARLAAVRDLAAKDDAGWLSQVYGENVEWTFQWQDDLRTVAYWFIDQQREIDT